MSEQDAIKIGVYTCHCGKNIADVIDVDELTEYAKTLPHVTAARNYKFMCSNTGQELILADINSGLVNRVVVAACSPLMHEPTFRSVLKKAGLNPYFFEQANIREEVSWVSSTNHEGALQVAKDHVRMAVAKVTSNDALSISKFPVLQEALVIGGGISGMYAALALADNFKTYLVESSPTIGGHMAQLDKTFPTMDCSACIITPKMVEVSRHPNINLLTYSEVESVQGSIGNFQVKIKKKTRKINHDICTGCGQCAQVCPVTTPNEFDLNMSHRSAAYIPFPQAIPPKYTIDTNACIECGMCVDACEVGAIDLSQQDEFIDLNVGAIVVTTGNDILDPSGLLRYNYYKSKNVVTGLQMERLLSSTGPMQGKIVRPSDGKEIESIVFLQCVGSRDFHEGMHKYCSRVCCMYALKQARLLKEKHPEINAYIFYIELRAFGKGYEEFYERTGRQYGVNFIRGRIGDVFIQADSSLKIVGIDTLMEAKIELDADMLVLCTAIEPRKGSLDLAKKIGFQCTEDGFYMEAHPKLRPVDTLVDGVYLAGTCQAPRDIPDTVSQAQAAAMRAVNFLSKKEVEIEPYYSIINEAVCSRCLSCVELCPYNAIKYDKFQNVVSISKVECKGCGTCVAACPCKAIEQNHFGERQVFSMIETAMPPVDVE
ncbi:MAG TPA: CoB--CoM heterodisulfide reductase iron-sulfur subunit A family protein [Candidatus Lokiarchaeia archaeon]|nr:CoB--CoM heterodisulfide reductase iron-sulfur subunit A family protein [Candidatus Lokiarchaeia archaeon]